MKQVETKYVDKNCVRICIGDILLVSDGCNNIHQGMVEIQGGTVVLTYIDTGGEEQAMPLDEFPAKKRTLLNEKGRYNYWKLVLGKEPPKSLWKIGA